MSRRRPSSRRLLVDAAGLALGAYPQELRLAVYAFVKRRRVIAAR